MQLRTRIGPWSQQNALGPADDPKKWEIGDPGQRSRTSRSSPCGESKTSFTHIGATRVKFDLANKGQVPRRKAGREHNAK